MSKTVLPRPIVAAAAVLVAAPAAATCSGGSGCGCHVLLLSSSLCDERQLSVAPLLANSILRVHLKQSLSALFVKPEKAGVAKP